MTTTAEPTQPAADTVARPGSTVGSALNTTRILRYLSRADRPVKLVDVSSDLSINTSTCLNILRTLVAEEFVRRTGKCYSLGPALLDIARMAWRRGMDVNLVKPMLDDFARRHDLNVALWQRADRDHMMVIATAARRSVVNIQMEPGIRIPLLGGSAGRIMAFAAKLTDEELRSRFKDVRWESPMSFEEFMQEVEAARTRGWSFEGGAYARGIRAMAVPIPNGDLPVDRAISIIGFVHDLPESRLPELGSELIGIAEAIARGDLLPHTAGSL